MWKPDAPFRQYSGTDESAHLDGYQTGLEWPAEKWKYVPGGPNVSSFKENDHPDWIEYCQTLVRHKEIWLMAWWEGFTKQANSNRTAQNLLTNLIAEKIMA